MQASKSDSESDIEDDLNPDEEASFKQSSESAVEESGSLMGSEEGEMEMDESQEPEDSQADSFDVKKLEEEIKEEKAPAVWKPGFKLRQEAQANQQDQSKLEQAV